MKIKFLIVISLVFSITLFDISSIYADGITIGKRSSLALNDASIDLGCLNITIEDTGTLDMGSGTISGLKNLYIYPGGIFIGDNGFIFYCKILSPGILELLLLE